MVRVGLVVRVGGRVGLVVRVGGRVGLVLWVSNATWSITKGLNLFNITGMAMQIKMPTPENLLRFS